MGLPNSKPDDDEKRKKEWAIHHGSRIERETNPTIQLMLFGRKTYLISQLLNILVAGDGGKTTILRRMMALHGNEYAHSFAHRSCDVFVFLVSWENARH